MHGMDTGFPSEFVEREAAAVFGLKLIQDTGDPARNAAAFAPGGASGTRQDFREQAFYSETLGEGRGLDFAKEFHPEPQPGATTGVVARCVQRCGAISESL